MWVMKVASHPTSWRTMRVSAEHPGGQTPWISTWAGEAVDKGCWSLRSFLGPPPALELLKTAIQAAGYPDKVVIGMDVAASEFYRNGKYDLDFKSPDDPARHITGEKLGELYKSFIKNYPGEALRCPSVPARVPCSCLIS